MKVRPAGAELFRADGQTDMTKPVVSSQFANAPTNYRVRQPAGA